MRKLKTSRTWILVVLLFIACGFADWTQSTYDVARTSDSYDPQNPAGAKPRTLGVGAFSIIAGSSLLPGTTTTGMPLSRDVLSNSSRNPNAFTGQGQSGSNNGLRNGSSLLDPSYGSFSSSGSRGILGSSQSLSNGYGQTGQDFGSAGTGTMPASGMSTPGLSGDQAP